MVLLTCRKTELELETGVGEFDIEMRLSETIDFMSPFMAPQGENPTIIIPDPIYVQVRASQLAANLRLMVSLTAA